MPTLPQSSHFYQTKGRAHDITLFRSITMFGATDKLIQNISSFRLNVRSILYNIVGPTKHYFWMGLNILFKPLLGHIGELSQTNCMLHQIQLDRPWQCPHEHPPPTTRASNHGYPSTRIFLYFQIVAAYFWLDLYVLTNFFSYL